MTRVCLVLALPLVCGFPTRRVLSRALTPRLPFALLRHRLSVEHTRSARGVEVSRVPTIPISAMPRSQTPPRSPRPCHWWALVVAFRYCDTVGPRMITSRGSIASPSRVAAWSSRCLRFTPVLADDRARLTSSWVASPSMTGIAPAPYSQLSRRTTVRYGPEVWLRPIRFHLTANTLPLSPTALERVNSHGSDFH